MKPVLLYLLTAIVGLTGLFSRPAAAQILIGGGPYSQNFDSLGSTSANWTNNTTLPGWYATKGSLDATNFIAGAGTGTTGGIYSFGTNGVNPATDRALGSVAGSSINYYYGVRFTNDTASAQTNFTVSCTGEQWRSGTTVPQMLTFAFQTSGSPITNALAGTWTNLPALNFTNPNPATTSGALDGNVATNRTVFANVVLTGVLLQPGQEIFLRWLDVDDSGSDSGLAIDDLTVSFSPSTPTTNPPVITTQPADQTVGVGDTATFTVSATGNPAPTYQWRFNAADLLNETNTTLTLNNVTTNQSGSYFVVASNSAGTTNSLAATLTVTSAPPVILQGAISLVTYNTHGNGITNWTTNSLQVQAIARQLQYLNPDIITLNEIPNSYSYEMTNFVTAFFPGYSLARNSGTDGFIRSVILSRFPITRSTSWLDGAPLDPFGYTGPNFTRDLFEAQITVPSFAQPLHVFVTHLKASTSNYTNDVAKRAAEAAAITNFFATNLFALYPLHPYILAGDMNEFEVTNLSIQRLTSPFAGLQLTSPTNPFTGKYFTYPIQTAAGNLATPSERIDYIFPCNLLASNIATSQVFRSDKLTNPPAPLLTNDDVTASDHLPVQMIFNNPYTQPIRVTAMTYAEPTMTAQWNSVFGGIYRVETSSNLVNWTTLATSLTATNASYTFTTNITGSPRFFRVRAP
ncbi:MAG: immunoglobulin domain-containing protein [Verrucomicrobia bacterium]|nr:immunoglobulin domain-containing protein [Verrucomicrobiota bacterium]